MTPTFGAAVRVWVRIALLSFGGPAGQIAMMHKFLVEERGWIAEARFLNALNFCMLLPGPEAQQMSIYLGWILHRTKGGVVAGLLFILPGVVTLMGLSWLYVLWGSQSVIAGLFFGLKAAVLAVVTQALIKLGQRALTSALSVVLAMTGFVALFAFGAPFPVVVLVAAAAGLAFATKSTPPSDEPDWRRPALRDSALQAGFWLFVWGAPVLGLLAWRGPDNIFTQLALFFSKTALVTFGGAYAIMAYVAQQAVGQYHWLQPDEMISGLALAETTPGPMIMVLQHIGFLAGYRTNGLALPPLLAGTLAGLLVTWVTFAPCFLWVLVGAPYIEGLRQLRWLRAALSGVTAAVVGVILNLALWFALQVLFTRMLPVRLWGTAFDRPDWSSLDASALILALAAGAGLFLFRWGVIPVLGLSALWGIALRLL